MKIKIYDKDLNAVLFVGEQFVSCLWSEGYNTIGSFCLELIDTAEYRQKIREDFYAGRSDRDTLMVIKTVEFRDGRIIASGKQATAVLDDVAMIGTIQNGANIDTAIANAYNNSAKFRKLNFAETSIGVKSTHQISNASFWKVCSTLCADTDLGIKVKKNGAELLAEFYKPEENPNLVFAKQYGNLSEPEITLSTEGAKNYAIVLGQGEGDNRTSTTVDMTAGQDRRELVVDAKDLRVDDGEAMEDYLKRLESRGMEKLLECQNVFSCSFVPSGKDFGVRYDLGDVLTVNLSEYGLKLKARVAKFSQKSQANKTETTVEVGKITIVR